MNNVLRIDTTTIKFLQKNGYGIQEDQDIVLKTLTMADGTERRNIAEKKKVTINLKFTKIDTNTLSNYLTLMGNDFQATYYSFKYKTFKTAIFRLTEKPNIEMIGSYLDVLEEFEVTLESV